MTGRLMGGSMPNDLQFQFSFVVTGLTEKQCDVLLRLVTVLVDLADGEVSGGFIEVEYEQEEPGSTENRD